MAGRKLRLVKDELEDISSELQKLGFTDYESKVYVKLLQLGPSTAYELSKAAGVPRSNTYSALDALAQRGAVLQISENPIRHVAADPDVLFERIAGATRALCDELARSLRTLAKPADTQHVWTVRGQEAVVREVARMFGQSRTCIWVKASDDVLRQHMVALREAAERDIDILIVLFGADAHEFRLSPNTRVYLHEGNGKRMGSTDNLFTVAVDHEEALTAKFESGGEVIAAHTHNRPIVNMAESLIRHDYYMAEICRRFGAEIEAAFGPYLRDLRLSCFTEEQAESFRHKTGMA